MRQLRRPLIGADNGLSPDLGNKFRWNSYQDITQTAPREFEYNHLCTRKWNSKCRLQNGGHFISVSMCWTLHLSNFRGLFARLIYFIQWHGKMTTYNIFLCYVFTHPHSNLHYSDVIMGAMASLIISVTSVYSTAHSGADQRKHQSSASLDFVHRRPVNSPHKWPVTRKCFHLMTSSWTTIE